MTEDNVDRIIEANHRMMFVMRYAYTVLLELGKFVPEENKQGIYWVIEAIENIVYLNKPLPPLPQE